MNFLKIGVIAILTMCAGCAHHSERTNPKARSTTKYSIQIESTTNYIVFDGLPEDSPGIDALIERVNKKTASRFIPEGSIDNKNKLKLKYNIHYYGHRAFPPVPFAMYWVKYEAELEFNDKTKTVNIYQGNDGSSNIVDLTNEMSENLYDYIMRNVY